MQAGEALEAFRQVEFFPKIYSSKQIWQTTSYGFLPEQKYLG